MTPPHEVQTTTVAFAIGTLYPSAGICGDPRTQARADARSCVLDQMSLAYVATNLGHFGLQVQGFVSRGQTLLLTQKAKNATVTINVVVENLPSEGFSR